MEGEDRPRIGHEYTNWNIHQAWYLPEKMDTINVQIKLQIRLD